MSHDPGIFSIFDSAPSSLTLIRERPLGLYYEEPSLRELLKPLPPPDRILFKHGAMFNRFVHSAARKRVLEHSQHGGHSGGSTTPRRKSPVQQQQHQQQSQHQQPSQRPMPASVGAPSGEQPHPRSKDAESSGTRTPGGVSQAGADDAVSNAEERGATTTATAVVVAPDSAAAAAAAAAAQADPAKSINLLSRNLRSTVQGGRPGNWRNRANSRGRSDGNGSNNPLVDLRQQPVPSARLPFRGLLPDEPHLILAEVRSAAYESSRETREFIAHGRDVIATKLAGTPLDQRRVSPLRAYQDLVKRSSPGRKQRFTAGEHLVEQPESGPRRASPLKLLISTALHHHKHQHSDDDDAGSAAAVEMDVAAYNREQDAEDEQFVVDESAVDPQGSAAASLRQTMHDPNLVAGIIAARAQLPPWKDEPKPDNAAALALAAGIKKRKPGAKQSSSSSSTPRWAQQTAANKAHHRRQSVTDSQQQQQQQQRGGKRSGGGGGDDGADKVEDNGGGVNLNDSTEHEALARKHLNFQHQLRNDGDKEELERLRQAQRKRALDEMILARLAPAEREERLSRKAELDPFRRQTDRNLPFPETAARDRWTQAQRKDKIPELVTEGLVQISSWKPAMSSNRGASGPSNSGRRSGRAAVSTDGPGAAEFVPSNASIVLQQLGLASAPAMTSTAATLGVAGVLRATSSMVPKEGTPRMRNPASPAQREQRAETVQRKHAENEDEHAERMQGLAAKLEARLSRAEARKKMF